MNIDQELTLQKAELLKLLSNPVRLCIIHQLSHYESCNVSHFVNCMNSSQPNISQHLSKLKSAGIVNTEKKANEVYYFLANDEVRCLISLLFPDKN